MSEEHSENAALDDLATVLNPMIGISVADLRSAFGEVLLAGARQPLVAAGHHAKFMAELLRIMAGQSDLQPDAKDKRFADERYAAHPYFRGLTQSWLAWESSLQEWVEDLGFEDQKLEQARFVSQLLIDALAPPNNLLANPVALEKARETKGLSLVKGLSNWLSDVAENQGMPSQVDTTQFKVGGNIANTDGAVIFRNEILELIQYQPSTDTQHAKPVLIVPPQINKFYLYDMSPEKSVVRYMLDNNLQTFIISWRNPTPDHRSWGMEAYVLALVEALDVVLNVTDQDSAHLVGACAGGITLSIALAYLSGIQQDHKATSLTLMVNVLKQSREDTTLGVFASDETIASSRKRSAKEGVLDGRDTAKIFSWMRPNDLIWNYVVSNYLLGETPPAFDILYWNNDTTCLPSQLHSDFLTVFGDDSAIQTGTFKIDGVEVKLSNITCPAYVTGGTTDHITPWHACYRTTQLLGGPVTFVLSTAGHIQSVLNPPTSSKRKYYLNAETPEDSEQWYQSATAHSGSWWPHWIEWLTSGQTEQITSPTIFGNEQHPPLEAAPGTYVHE